MRRLIVSSKLVPALAVCTGCSTIEVPDSARTTDPAFNGVWTGTISAAESIQLPDTLWNDFSTFFCDALKATIKLQINDGVINGVADFASPVEFSANVSQTGIFYANVPRNSTFLIDGRSRYASKEFHVFKGQVDPLERKVQDSYLSAVGDISQGGCTYVVNYRLVS